MKNTPPLIDQLRDWLDANKATIKATGLAKKAGVDNGTVSRWLLGKNEPNDGTIDKLATAAKAYGFSPTL